MWNLVAIEKLNEVQIFKVARWLSEAHLHQIWWYLDLYIGSYGFIFEGYKIYQKYDNYWIGQESLWLKGPQVENIFISGWGN
jgi:hypothetical protein